MNVDDIMVEAHETPKRHAKHLDIVALAETVARINKATEQSTLETVKVARVLSEAPAALNQAVREGFQSSLEDLNKKEQALSLRLAAINKQGKNWLYIIIAMSVFVGGAMVAASLLWFGPEITRYTEYRNSHQAVEEGSLFGARIGEHNGNTYILFDDGIVVDGAGECASTNCIRIKH